MEKSPNFFIQRLTKIKDDKISEIHQIFAWKSCKSNLLLANKNCWKAKKKLNSTISTPCFIILNGSFRCFCGVDFVKQRCGLQFFTVFLGLHKTTVLCTALRCKVLLLKERCFFKGGCCVCLWEWKYGEKCI